MVAPETAFLTAPEGPQSFRIYFWRGILDSSRKGKTLKSALLLIQEDVKMLLQAYEPNLKHVFSKKREKTLSTDYNRIYP